MDVLKEIVAAEKDAVDFGFTWPNSDMAIDQAADECREIKEALLEGNSQKIQEEIGDLLHAGISLCVFAGFDVEETLCKAKDKFSARMAALKILAEERGFQSLEGQSTEVVLSLWKEAKKKAWP